MLGWLLCALGIAGGVNPQETQIAADIWAGRKALEAGEPREAQRRFSSALTYREASKDDRFAALVGLGKADLWLGQYRAAETAFRGARAMVSNATDRCVADTGLARALNSLERYGSAYALMIPCASGSLKATVELLRAGIALGLVDKTEQYVAASPTTAPASHLGAEFGRLTSDVTLQLSNRGEGDLLYSHDSDGLSVQTYRLGTWLPGGTGGTYFDVWHASASTSSVEDTQRHEQVNEIGAGSATRIGDVQHLRKL